MTKEPEVPDYAFYGEGMQVARLSGLVVPLRRVLRRIQRPWFQRQVEILYELRQAIAAQESLLSDARKEMADLRALIEAGDARSWDQTAIARRLASLEDASVILEGTGSVHSEEH